MPYKFVLFLAQRTIIRIRPKCKYRSLFLSGPLLRQYCCCSLPFAKIRSKQCKFSIPLPLPKQAMISLQAMAYVRLLLNQYLYCFFFQIFHDYPLFLYVFTAIFNDLKLILEYVFILLTL